MTNKFFTSNRLFITVLLTAITSCVVFLSCKKEKEAPVFTAQGYWTGKVYVYNAALLNRDNGTTRFYVGVTGTDTTAAQLKLEGNYISNGNSFEAVYDVGNNDTAYLEADKIVTLFMTGLYRTKNITGATFPFEFKK